MSELIMVLQVEGSHDYRAIVTEFLGQYSAASHFQVAAKLACLRTLKVLFD